MKRFLIKAGLITLFFLALFICLEKIYDRIIPRDLSIKPYTIFSLEGGKYDFAVLGSSKAEFGMDIHTLERMSGRQGINLAMQGARYADSYVVLEKFLRKNRVKQVLLDVSVLGFDSRYSSLQFSAYYYLPYRNDPVISAVMQDHATPRAWWVWNHVPFSGYIEFNHYTGLVNLYHILAKTEPKFDGKGTRLVRGPSEFYPVPESRCSVEPLHRKYFEKIILLCRKAGIEVVLIGTPEYAGDDKAVVNRAEMLDFISREAQKSGIRFISFEDHPFRKEKKYFHDYSHLNAAGALEFSRILADSLWPSRDRQEFPPTELSHK